MNDSLSIYDREQTTVKLYTDLATTDREAFRRAATSAYESFNVHDRVFIDKFESTSATPYDVLILWKDMLLPVSHTLRTKRSDLMFRNAMMKHLVLDTDEVQSTIHQVINMRESDAIRKFTVRLYPLDKKKDTYRKQRAHIADLLLMFQQEIFDLKDRYVSYMMYKYVAQQQEMTIIDPYASFLKRAVAARRIRAERRNVIRAEQARLACIQLRIHELRTANGMLLGDILDMNVDLIVVLGLRNQYEKHIAKLPTSDAISAAKRLAIFETETQTFREGYIDSATTDPVEVSLEITRSMTKSIDGLLLRIFDLPMMQKNQLLVHAKQYRELTRERADILQAQQTRSLSR